MRLLYQHNFKIGVCLTRYNVLWYCSVLIFIIGLWSYLEVYDSKIESISSVRRKIKERLKSLENTYGIEALREAINFSNQDQQVTSLLNKIKLRKVLKVAVIGGSVCAGASLNQSDETFSEHFTSELNGFLGERSYKSVSVCLPSCGSYVLRFCLNEYLSLKCKGDSNCTMLEDFYNSDIIFLDFAANDFVNMQNFGYNGENLPENELLEHPEFLLRKFLSFPTFPLVVFVHFSILFKEKNGRISPILSAEGPLSKLSLHYGIPSVSLSRIFSKNFEFKPWKNHSYGDFLLDQVHPTAEGHKIIGDFLLYLLLSKLKDVKAASSTTNPRNSTVKLPSPVFLSRNSLQNPLFCHFGNTWNISSRKNWIMAEPEALKYKNFHSEVKFWEAQVSESATLKFSLEVKRDSEMGVLFRRSGRKMYKKMGAEIFYNDKKVGILGSFWFKSRFTIWHLRRKVFNCSAGIANLSIKAKRQGFQILALIGE